MKTNTSWTASPLDGYVGVRKNSKEIPFKFDLEMIFRRIADSSINEQKND